MPVIFALYHYIGNMYHWTWDYFWKVCPMPVIRQLTKLIEQKSDKGFLSHFEVALFKVAARKGGFRGFDD